MWAKVPRCLKKAKTKFVLNLTERAAGLDSRLNICLRILLSAPLWYLFRLGLLIGVSYVILQPFFSKIMSSFMSSNDFVDVTVKLIPRYPTLNTYKAIFTENGYFEALFNTTTLSLLCAVVQTFICCLIGYGFAKFKFRGNKFLLRA